MSSTPPAKADFDLGRIAEVPDPFADAVDSPLPAGRVGPLASPHTSRQVRTMRWAALAGGLAYQAVWLLLLHKRGDLQELPLPTLAVEMAVPFAAAALAFAGATGTGARGMGERKARLVALATLAPAVFALATLLAAPQASDGEAFWQHATRCFVVTALLAAGPLAFAAWAFRGAFVALPRWRTAALGMACGALAAASMSLICSVGTASHVLVGHGGILALAGVAGALLGRRFGSA